MNIQILNPTETLLYAADELKKYITLMSEGYIHPTVTIGNKKPDSKTITLATLGELSLDTSDLSDPFLEDIIDIDVTALDGYIAGSNERSILMGVYKFCYSAGCRYIRPGENGDYIPSVDLYAHSFKYRKKADKLFRGECCEGAISYEDMRDTVYWLPKIGMNMYLIEGLVPYTYMHKWYGHVYNTKLRIPGQITEYESLEKYITMLERDVKRTGIQLHTLGHAWMFEALGIHHTDPAREADALSKLSKDQIDALALLNGKRGISCGSSFFTHFCYSNPGARKILIDYLVNYVKEKPHVDFIHAWLADNINNQCECEECQKMTPSDWYVLLLNELDEELTKVGSNARIVFILYVDTVRPPITMRLKNPRRFVILSAIGQFYEDGYNIPKTDEEVPTYVRNKYVEFSHSLYLKCHEDWKKLSGGIPSIIYEYRYYVDMYCDPSYMRISRETHSDMKTLGSISFEGCMSDQTHRTYLPTALPMITMGETLYDHSTDFEKLADEYFEGAFGKDGAKVRAYLEGLTPLLSPSNFRVGGKGGAEEAGLGNMSPNKRSWRNNPLVAKNAAKVPEHLDSFLPVIEENIKAEPNAARRQSWIYLRYHTEICRYHAEILRLGALGNIEDARAKFSELRDYLSEHELEFHKVFDLFLYLRAWSQKFEIAMPGYFD